MPQYTVTDLVGRFTQLEEALNHLQTMQDDVLQCLVYHLPAPSVDESDIGLSPDNRKKPERTHLKLLEIDPKEAITTVLKAWSQLEFTDKADGRFADRYPGVVKVTPRLLEHLRRINFAKKSFRLVATNRVVRTSLAGKAKEGRQFQFHQLRDHLNNRHLNMTYAYRHIPIFEDFVDQQRFVWSKTRALYKTFVTAEDAEIHFNNLVANREKDGAGFVVPKNYKDIIASVYGKGLIIQQRQDAPPQLYFDLYTKSDRPNQRYVTKRHSASVPVATTEDISDIAPPKLKMEYSIYALPKDSGFQPMFEGLKSHYYIGES